MASESRLSALIHWLIAGAPGPVSFSDLLGEIGQRLQAADLPVDEFGIYKTLIHPELPGRLDYWSPAAGPRTITLTPQQLQEPSWIGTPAQVCQSTGRMVVCTLGNAPEFDDRDDMQKLKSRGYTQIVCLPLHSRYTPALNSVGFSTKREGGFAPDHVEAFRRLQAPMARITEGFVLHESTIEVLSTYVGRDAGARVLTGNILRGDTEVIPSIVLFVDVKDYSALSNKLPPRAVIDLLNRFFTGLDDAIRRHGGEILKLVGDGALCIFPTPDDHSAQVAATSSALAALEDARSAFEADASATNPEFRAALHLGDVHYGNIGSHNRLDFTVVGPTVNLTARLLSAASDYGEDTVFSKAIASLLDSATRCLGEQTLKGFDQPIEIHTLA
jgi:adenylate cyclase